MSALEILSHLPSASATKPPLLFVHGAWHGAWCWENFLPWFAARGYPAYALSLRGHAGSRTRRHWRWHSAAHDYTADVAAAVARLPQPPVLVGHSLGAYVVQKYLEKHAVPAAVLMAPLPVSGIGRVILRLAARHPIPFLKAQFLFRPRHLVGTPALAHDLLFSPDTPRHEVCRHFGRLQEESVLMELETLFFRLPRPNRVTTPILVMAAGRDRIFSMHESRATARAYGGHLHVFENMAHNLMLEPGWPHVAKAVADWLSARGL